MADPDDIVAIFGIATKNHWLDVPFDFSCRPIVPLKVYSAGGHLKGARQFLSNGTEGTLKILPFSSQRENHPSRAARSVQTRAALLGHHNRQLSQLPRSLQTG
jgi:hypothetical protein